MLSSHSTTEHSLTDFEDVEELLPVDDETSSETPALLQSELMQSYIQNDLHSRFPCLLLNPSLQIMWQNGYFSTTFPKDEHPGDSLFSLISATSEDVKNKIVMSLRRREDGYSWKSSEEIPRRSLSTLHATFLISPIFAGENDGSQLPAAYRVVIDDVTEDLNTLIRGTFSSLLEASLLKDQDTGEHVARINSYCKKLSEIAFAEGVFSEIDKPFIDTIGFVAAMHDVGKIGTPDDILNKDGPLDDWQWDIMKEHTINGAYILNTYPSPMAKQIALFHHERWNGTGYPYGWNEENIPLSARIVAITDVYDALRMKRPYKEPFTHDATLAEIENGIGKHFDPMIARLFIRHDREFDGIYNEQADR